MFEADAKDPPLLKELERYDLELSALPQVGSVASLATVVKEISKALNDPTEPGYDQILRAGRPLRSTWNCTP